jgi:hypothetical protein
VTPEEGWVERLWSEDGVERPVVLPMTRMIRKAMEVVLGEEDALVHEKGDRQAGKNQSDEEVVRGEEEAKEMKRKHDKYHKYDEGGKVPKYDERDEHKYDSFEKYREHEKRE